MDESATTMLSRTNLAVEQSVSHGHLVLQDAALDLYAVFQSSLPAGEALITGIEDAHGYTYGRVMHKRPPKGTVSVKEEEMRRGLRLTRTEDEVGRLIQENAGYFDIELRQSLLVLPEHRVDEVIKGLGVSVEESDIALSSVAAERLYRATRARNLSFAGIAIEACATYNEFGLSAELVIVDATGGYSFGVKSTPGMVTEEQLLRMSEPQQSAHVG